MSGNDTVFDDGEIVGWVPSSTDRGTIDVLWSCCFTIVLCVWVSTYPNVPSKSDTWYERLIDKVNLAFIGLLGPDLLLGLALGQLGEARKIVRVSGSLSCRTKIMLL